MKFFGARYIERMVAPNIAAEAEAAKKMKLRMRALQDSLFCAKLMLGAGTLSDKEAA